MCTGDWWWREQVRNKLCAHGPELTQHRQELAPPGATIVPIILGYDSTCLTNFSGGKKAWPVMMSIGNIHSKVRNSPSNRAWILIAYIPIVDFLDDDKIRTTLQNRVFHQCMEVVLQPLIKYGTTSVFMTDSIGATRAIYPILAANICDYPEQCLTTCAGYLSSPVTTARYLDLGSDTLLPPRTREWILSQIQGASAEADPNDVKAYLKAAKERGLNGVHLPFWRNLPRYSPEIAVGPDVLHGLIKCFHDHILKWSLKLIGAEEYDMRLRALQPVIGYKHFKNGIKHLSQMTCREHRELQRTHVALIAGCPKITPKVLQNTRAYCNFSYLAQYQYHNNATLQYLEEALRIFHRTKGEYIKLGVRKTGHLQIPKLYGMLFYSRHIREMGSSSQYSTEIVESLHRPLAKEPYTFTNRKNFAIQMCRRLDRVDRMAHLQELIEFADRQDEIDWMNTAVSVYSPRYKKRAIANYLQSQQDPKEARSVRNRMSASRLWLSDRPHLMAVDIETIAFTYQLPDLVAQLHRYLLNLYFFKGGISTLADQQLQVACIDVWRKLTIRAPDVQDDELVSMEHSVEAVPPSPDLPYGRCHCVLVHCGDQAAATGIEGTLLELIERLD
jgi:hypothetical protein